MLRCLLACVFVAITGCGGEPYRLAPVSGVVTLDGDPLPDARVGFEPRGDVDVLNVGPGSYGKTDAQGRYTLETLQGDEGAVVGTHNVSISTFQGKADPAVMDIEVVTPERVPKRYLDGDALTFTVPVEGTETADFHLTSE